MPTPISFRLTTGRRNFNSTKSKGLWDFLNHSRERLFCGISQNRIKKEIINFRNLKTLYTANQLIDSFQFELPIALLSLQIPNQKEIVNFRNLNLRTYSDSTYRRFPIRVTTSPSPPLRTPYTVLNHHKVYDYNIHTHAVYTNRTKAQQRATVFLFTAAFKKKSFRFTEDIIGPTRAARFYWAEMLVNFSPFFDSFLIV